MINWIDLAAKAKKDPSLIPNHKGTVDKKLKEKLQDNLDLLKEIKGDNDLSSMIIEIKVENVKIKKALKVYE